MIFLLFDNISGILIKLILYALEAEKSTTLIFVFMTCCCSAHWVTFIQSNLSSNAWHRTQGWPHYTKGASKLVDCGLGLNSLFLRLFSLARVRMWCWKSTSIILFWFPQKPKPPHHVAPMSQSALMGQNGESVSAKWDRCSISDNFSSSSLWNACQAAECVGWRFPLLRMEHLFLLLLGGVPIHLCGLWGLPTKQQIFIRRRNC